MYRFTVIFVIVLMVFMLFQVEASAEAMHTLSFDLNHQLKILLVADTQDTDQPQQAMLDLLHAALDEAQPHLVIFLGDMIHGSAVRDKMKVEKAIDAILQPVVQRKIPFALVFGNHDAESGVSNDEQLKIYQSYRGSLAIEGENLPGCGNYYLLIHNGIDRESPLILWFLDSGSYAEPGRGLYGYVTEEQNAWMLSTNREILTRYKSPVSYVFQHIPVPQVYDMMLEVPYGTKDAVTCYGPNFLKWYVPSPDHIWEGKIGEGPCSSEYDSGEFDAWKTMGIRAAFFGHDHLNDYCGTLEGIDLIATTGIGFYMYGRGDEHGARLLVLNAEQPESYQTKMIYYKDLDLGPLPALFVPVLGVRLQGYVIIGVCVILMILTFAFIVIRFRRKRKKKHAEI